MDLHDKIFYAYSKFFGLSLSQGEKILSEAYSIGKKEYKHEKVIPNVSDED